MLKNKTNIFIFIALIFSSAPVLAELTAQSAELAAILGGANANQVTLMQDNEMSQVQGMATLSSLTTADLATLQALAANYSSSYSLLSQIITIQNNSAQLIIQNIR